MTRHLTCPDCEKLTLWQRLIKRAHDAERERDLRDAAQQHIISHESGLAPGAVTREVREIAEAQP